MEEFGARENGQKYYFKSCCCSVENGRIYVDRSPPEKLYCEECYESFDEHKETCDEDDRDVMWCSDSTFEWEISREAFEEKGTAFIREHQDLVNSIIEITIVDNEYSLKLKTDENGNKLDIPKEHQRMFADFCMLKQIEDYFNKNEDEDYCEWSAEY